jgi:hypothetical protein
LYPKLQNNPDCVKKLITFEFYQAQNDYLSSYQGWIVAGMIISYIL